MNPGCAGKVPISVTFPAHRDEGEAHERTLGFAGLGAMGAGIAQRLIAAGHDVTVWNRTKSEAEPLLDARREVGRLAARARGVRATWSSRC